MGNKGNKGNSNRYPFGLTFDPDSDNSIGTLYRIDRWNWEDNIPQVLKNYYDHEIQSIRICIHPLHPPGPLLYHAFVVFKTKTKWWSIEKDSTEILLQCSDYIDYVRDHKQTKIRMGRIIGDYYEYTGTKTIQDIISFVYHQEFMSFIGIGYHIIVSNCKDFAVNIYNEFSKNDDKISVLKLNGLDIFHRS